MPHSSDRILMAAIRIRFPRSGDEAAWRRLWALYLAFYETELDEAVTAATWRRALAAEQVFLRLAEEGSHLRGFALCILHEGSWCLEPICYLEDLFVDPKSRGSGIGRALIEDLIDLGRKNRWSRLYWHTEAGNEAARRLYDRFTTADGFVRYRITLS
jgi:GNAT superfamily N-acetyltransferase